MDSSASIKRIIGIDIGGTNIRAGIYSSDGALSHFTKSSSQSLFEEVDASVERLIHYVEHLMEQNGGQGIDAIAIGFPSTLDHDRKVVVSTPNLKGLNNCPIVSLLEEALNIPVFIERDVNLLTLYDMADLHLSEQGVTLAFYLGTGLGNAIVINGEFLVGKNGAAAELGHIPMRDIHGLCGCGNTSCVEIEASGKALEALKTELFPHEPLEKIFVNHSDHPALQRFVEGIAYPLATEINIFDPDHVILGGGVISMEGFPYHRLESKVHELLRKPYPSRSLEVNFSRGGQKCGVVGAGMYGLKMLERRSTEKK
ncbi:MAG: allose kinase [Peptoniphilaceae bacterium]|nr:allose kinase [Peptoniphilaceae bacterium]MDY6086220.1 allose kinase [Peptoniphilaceae bacterium]